MSPFTVLHVCMGNICRSPMAERLLALALRQQVGGWADELYHSHSAGTGSWHTGEPMDISAARQITVRGGDASGFRARQVSLTMIDSSDLVLCATAQHAAYACQLCPDAASRTFVLGELGRLLRMVDLGALPPIGRVVASARDRGVALVRAADALRGGPPAGFAVGHRGPTRGDDLADPWGSGDHEFARVADLIEHTVVPLARALTAVAE